MWFRTKVDPAVALEYATLITDGLFEPPSLAKSLGRFLGCPILVKVGKYLEQPAGKMAGIEYGSDHHLYLGGDGLSSPGEDIAFDGSEIAPVGPVMNLLLSTAIRSVRQGDRVAGSVSGLLRTQIMEDALGMLSRDHGEKVLLMAMNPQDYLTFRSEYRPVPSTYPLIRNKVYGLIPSFNVPVSEEVDEQGNVPIMVTARVEWHQILVIGESKVVIINAD